MLKLRSIGLSDYSVLEGEHRHWPHPFRPRAHAGRLALESHRPSDRRTPHGLSQGPRYGQGRVRSSHEGQDHAEATRGGLPGNER